MVAASDWRIEVNSNGFKSLFCIRESKLPLLVLTAAELVVACALAFVRPVVSSLNKKELRSFVLLNLSSVKEQILKGGKWYGE